MKDQDSCSKCGHAAGKGITRCPECGSWMPRARGIRIRGGILIFLGLVLVGMMGTISIVVAPIMFSDGSGGGTKFSATPAQAVLIMGLFGAVIVFGVACILSGIVQLVTGRRNILIVILIVGIAVFLIILGFAVIRSLDNRQRTRLLRPDRYATLERVT
jgi:hypothetical protein